LSSTANQKIRREEDHNNTATTHFTHSGAAIENIQLARNADYPAELMDKLNDREKKPGNGGTSKGSELKIVFIHLFFLSTFSF